MILEIRPDTVHHIEESDLTDRPSSEILQFSKWAEEALRDQTNQSLPTIMEHLRRVQELLAVCMAA